MSNDKFCDNQPLHLTGQIQPHGVMLTVSKKDFKIVQVSENTEILLGSKPPDVLNQSLESFVSRESFLEIQQKTKIVTSNLALAITYKTINKYCTYLSLLHEKDECIIIEIEFINIIQGQGNNFSSVFQQLQQVMSAINFAKSIQEIASIAANQIKTITGFDKVMIYFFDEEWNGTVIAEEMNAGMETYLGLKFPASDVPKQARDLYLKSPYRLIPNRDYTPCNLVPDINPLTGKMTNLSDCRLRSVVSVHLEYLKNMHVMSSMSTRIIYKEKLWGLIACHHRTPKYLSFEECSVLEFISNVISAKLSSVINLSSHENNNKLNGLYNQLTQQIGSDENLTASLKRNDKELLSMLGADSVAICWNNEIETIGNTPHVEEIKKIRDWLTTKSSSKIFHSDSLPLVFDDASAYSDIASGLLALSIQPYQGNYILAFRTEVIQDINWGGNPQKTIVFEENSSRYHPRNSFQIWKQTIRNTCIPWPNDQLAIAEKFRNAIVERTLQALTRTLEEKVRERTESLLKSKTELEETYNELMQITYVATHDLQEPVRKINIFGNMLKEIIQDEIPNNYLNRIMASSIRIRTLLTDLLIYSRLTYPTTVRQTNLNDLLKEILSDLDQLIIEKEIVFSVTDLPEIEAVPDQMRQVFYNLIINSIKFSNTEKASRIDIYSELVDSQDVSSSENMKLEYCRIVVKDNGIGFPQEYAKRLFDVFKKFHGEEYEGTGIGLAITKKIVEKHNGQIFAEGKENEGASFIITLPLKQH